MSNEQIPEQVYLDAARAYCVSRFNYDGPYATDADREAHIRRDAEGTALDNHHLRAVVASAYRAGQAAAPDGPCTWQLPDEPGPEVTAVRNAKGATWDRDGDGWRYRKSSSLFPEIKGVWRRWDGLLITEGSLTDATPADGQDGDGHG